MPQLRHARPLVATWASVRPGRGLVDAQVAATANLVDALGLRDIPRTRGNCVSADPEMFFADSRRDASVRAAKALCQGCAIRQECVGLGGGYDGVWGGLTKLERKRRGQDVLAQPGDTPPGE